MAEELGVEKDVMFLGARSDLPRLYQVMDVFMLPSLFEGFGIVNIEAQTSGLKCITSTAVPEAVNVTGNVARLPLDGPTGEWIREIFDVPAGRRDYSQVIKDKGFDMATSARELESLYRKALG
jgi:glycosyltransferase involved in cell wall biosynthesis